MPEDDIGGMKMPGWFFKTLLAWALIVGHGGIAGYINDHYDLKELRQTMARIQQEGTQALRDHLMQEVRADQQLTYLQQDVDQLNKKQDGLDEKMSQMLLQQRDLINEIRAVRNYQPDGG